MKKYIGSKVKRYRDEKGYSQEGLGALIGKSKSTVQRIEDGKQEPDRDLLDRIATVLGKEPEDFYLANSCDIIETQTQNAEAVNTLCHQTIHSAGGTIPAKYVETLEKLLESRARETETLNARHQADQQQIARLENRLQGIQREG